ncbi:MAG TPA: GlsB/YeaQ/YmgE family stress response membrane protein [Vicinamibacteria bacterium]
MDLIINLIVGGIIGWLASLVMKTNNQMGVIANIIVGIIGSGLGAWVFSLVGLAAYGTLGRLLMGVVGAALLIALLRGLGFYK